MAELFNELQLSYSRFILEFHPFVMSNVDSIEAHLKFEKRQRERVDFFINTIFPTLGKNVLIKTKSSLFALLRILDAKTLMKTSKAFKRLKAFEVFIRLSISQPTQPFKFEVYLSM